MQSASTRNAIAHAVHSYETQRIRTPQGRRRKLSVAYILERIFYVCNTECQWSQLEVPESSYKTVYHYFNLWFEARLFENVFYAAATARQPVGGFVVVDSENRHNARRKAQRRDYVE